MAGSCHSVVPHPPRTQLICRRRLATYEDNKGPLTANALAAVKRFAIQDARFRGTGGQICQLNLKIALDDGVHAQLASPPLAAVFGDVAAEGVPVSASVPPTQLFAGMLNAESESVLEESPAEVRVADGSN